VPKEENDSSNIKQIILALKNNISLKNSFENLDKEESKESIFDFY
jgi:hypothetical protein